MTVQTTNTSNAVPGRSLLAAIGRGFHAFGKGFHAVVTTLQNASGAARCAREAERLFAMSDAQLAARGLKRDEIIHHAFRHYLCL